MLTCETGAVPWAPCRHAHQRSCWDASVTTTTAAGTGARLPQHRSMSRPSWAQNALTAAPGQRQQRAVQHAQPLHPICSTAADSMVHNHGMHYSTQTTRHLQGHIIKALTMHMRLCKPATSLSSPNPCISHSKHPQTFIPCITFTSHTCHE
jgi:hypothetical protein